MHTQVCMHATEIGREVLRISDGIGRLHLLSRPLTDFVGSVEAGELVEDAMKLWAPVASQASLEIVRAPGAASVDATPLALSPDAGRLIVLGALAAVVRGSEGLGSLELAWERSENSRSIDLCLRRTGGGVRFLEEEVYRHLVGACKASFEADDRGLRISLPLVA
jgi:hypothetical protein